MAFDTSKINAKDIAQNGGTRNVLAIGETVYVTTSPIEVARQASIIQDILENIIDSNVTVEPHFPDVHSYSILRKIEHNKIISYKNAYSIFMENRIIIARRLEFLENNGKELATEKLYKIVKLIYAKHCQYENPDQIIRCMCDELKEDVNKDNRMSNDDTAYIPAIIFYVFSECQFMTKPPIQ